MNDYYNFLKHFSSLKEKEEFNPFISIREVKKALTRKYKNEYLWSSISDRIYTSSFLDDLFEPQDTVEVHSGYRYDTETDDLSTITFNTTSYTVSSPLLEDPDRWFTVAYND